MALPLKKVLRNAKFDAVVSFKKSDVTKTSKPNSLTTPGGKISPKTTPGVQRKTSKPSTKSQGKSPKQGKTKEQGGITSSVVAVLADKGASRKNSQPVVIPEGDPANRADRLQVRLNALEVEMNRLKLHEEQLEHRLKFFLRQKTVLISTIDDIHMKLESLARTHKAVSASE